MGWLETHTFTVRFYKIFLNNSRACMQAFTDGTGNGRGHHAHFRFLPFTDAINSMQTVGNGICSTTTLCSLYWLLKLMDSLAPENDAFHNELHVYMRIRWIVVVQIKKIICTFCSQQKASKNVPWGCDRRRASERHVYLISTGRREVWRKNT